MTLDAPAPPSPPSSETTRALLIGVSFFLVFVTYYALKPVRESLLLSVPGGAELKSYTGAFQAIIFAVLVPIYGRLVDRVGGRRLVPLLHLFFAMNLVVFSLFAARGGAPIGVAFFLWTGLFNLTVVSQTWSLANDLTSPAAGRRLFPFVALGSVGGAAVGSLVVVTLAKSLGALSALLFGAGALIVTALITRLASRTGAPTPPTGTPPTGTPRTRTTVAQGFALIARSRYLLLVAAITVTANLVNTNSEYMLGRLVAAAAAVESAAGGVPARELVAGFYGTFYLYVNVTVLALQLLVAPWLARRLGGPTLLFALPLVALGANAVVLAWPLLAVLRVTKVAENATNYSLNNTARELLWLKLSPEEKYKAKEAVDTVGWRLGDTSSALLVAALTGLAGLGTTAFAAVNIGFIGLWLVLIVLLRRADALSCPPSRPDRTQR